MTEKDWNTINGECNKELYTCHYGKDDDYNIGLIKKKVKVIVGDSTEIEATQKIAEWCKKNTNYEKYYAVPPRCGKSVLGEFMQKGVNCSDIAPHQKEIDILTQMGFTPKQIMKILYGDMND